jgi:EGF-like domain
VDKNECLDAPCLNGGVCINQDPRHRYRCICPENFWGENCELVQEGQTLKLSMGALAAILVCLLIILSTSATHVLTLGSSMLLVECFKLLYSQLGSKFRL